MCTTSTECKIVITAVLTVKSGMDPRMISRDIGWSGMVGLLDVLVGAGEYPGRIVPLELDVDCHVVQLELEFLCSVIQLDLDVCFSRYPIGAGCSPSK
jgi:hypothetical protein